ncbi:hypothetical protein BJ165DRAFT_1398189 [Panaeolus papilionaceus]|nr:hypothetical protein BJ165DRAFT_1398189 [Panaeolus papilionaceus]
MSYHQAHGYNPATASNYTHQSASLGRSQGKRPRQDSPPKAEVPSAKNESESHHWPEFHSATSSSVITSSDHSGSLPHSEPVPGRSTKTEKTTTMVLPNQKLLSKLTDLEKDIAMGIGCILVLTQYDGVIPTPNQGQVEQLMIKSYQFLVSNAASQTGTIQTSAGTHWNPWAGQFNPDVIDFARSFYHSHLRERRMQTYCDIQAFLSLDNLPYLDKKKFLTTYLSSYQVSMTSSNSDSGILSSTVTTTALLHDTVGVQDTCSSNASENWQYIWYSGQIINHALSCLNSTLRGIDKKLDKSLKSIGEDSDMDTNTILLKFRCGHPEFFGAIEVPGTVPYRMWRCVDTFPKNVVVLSIVEVVECITYMWTNIIDHPGPIGLNLSPQTYAQSLDSRDISHYYGKHQVLFAETTSNIDSLLRPAHEAFLARIKWCFKTSQGTLETPPKVDSSCPSPIPGDLHAKIVTLINDFKSAGLTSHSSAANFPLHATQFHVSQRSQLSSRSAPPSLIFAASDSSSLNAPASHAYHRTQMQDEVLNDVSKLMSLPTGAMMQTASRHQLGAINYGLNRNHPSITAPSQPFEDLAAAPYPNIQANMPVMSSNYDQLEGNSQFTQSVSDHPLFSFAFNNDIALNENSSDHSHQWPPGNANMLSSTSAIYPSSNPRQDMAMEGISQPQLHSQPPAATTPVQNIHAMYTSLAQAQEREMGPKASSSGLEELAPTLDHPSSTGSQGGPPLDLNRNHQAYWSSFSKLLYKESIIHAAQNNDSMFLDLSMHDILGRLLKHVNPNTLLAFDSEAQAEMVSHPTWFRAHAVASAEAQLADSKAGFTDSGSNLR